MGSEVERSSGQERGSVGIFCGGSGEGFKSDAFTERLLFIRKSVFLSTMDMSKGLFQ